jgi:hypothetical protein
MKGLQTEPYILSFISLPLHNFMLLSNINTFLFPLRNIAQLLMIIHEISLKLKLLMKSIQ